VNWMIQSTLGRSNPLDATSCATHELMLYHTFFAREHLFWPARQKASFAGSKAENEKIFHFSASQWHEIESGGNFVCEESVFCAVEEGEDK
jgi:hypothetical protein